MALTPKNDSPTTGPDAPAASTPDAATDADDSSAPRSPDSNSTPNGTGPNGSGPNGSGPNGIGSTTTTDPSYSGDPSRGSGTLASDELSAQLPQQLMSPHVTETMSGDSRQALFGLLAIAGVALCLSGAAWLTMRYNPRLAFLLAARHDTPAPPSSTTQLNRLRRDSTGWRWQRPP
ncbi:hypothetical protein MF672_017300 [Actinomadura sp. ATCC 31491]|uniref:Uncharacterized protein n=1 Tax=Actinomadura luzonensis TaxID=2805427 RepID=A0ABT0FT59_9ACTN|nr:hypothetical protein [Actinomadura luzonensis]MCK2215529.1 hypothetical protein [Actinomadura luzonensis]